LTQTIPSLTALAGLPTAITFDAILFVRVEFIPTTLPSPISTPLTQIMQ